MIKKYFALSLIAASVAVAGCSDDDDDDNNGVDPTTPGEELPVATPGEGGSVYDYIVNTDTLSSLRTAIDTAGLADALDDESAEYTVFAPDNAAFEALNTEEAPTALADLMADPDALARVLQYHVITGTVNSEELGAAVAIATEEAPATYATLIDGESVTVDLSATANTGLAVNGSDISAVDLVPEVAEGETTAGLVHTIVDVLEAPEATEPTDPVDPDPVDPGESGAVFTAMQNDPDGFEKVIATLGNNTIKLDENDSSEDPWNIFAPTDAALGDAEFTLSDMVHVGARKTPADLIAAGSVTTFDGSKTYTIGGTDEASLTIGGAPAILLGGGTSVAYKLTAVPVAD